MRGLRIWAIALSVVALVAGLLPVGSVAAQKWPPPLAAVIEPDPVDFYGLGSRQTIEVQVKEVYSFFAADFTLTFDPTLIKVVSVESGPDWGHANQSGAPLIQVGVGTVTYANTRFSDPILMVDSITLARITFESVSAGAVGGIAGAFTLTTNVADGTGAFNPVPSMGTLAYTIFTASGIAGQALWPSPVVAPNHWYIPVQVTDLSGNVLGQDYTDGDGFYPTLGIFPAMPANGQIRINPITSGIFFWGWGRIPALETRLTGCPAGMNVPAHSVRLVGGDVAPLHPGVQGDNKIDISDLVLAASRFNMPVIDTNGDNWNDGDVNNDGLVNITDIVIIANNYGMRGPICESCP
jgi:hypothetical protein